MFVSNMGMFCIVLLGLFAAANAVAIVDVSENEWQSFKSLYSKTYETENEEVLRRINYMENKRYIDEHNEKYERGEVSYRMGLNKYSDMSAEEFNRVMNGYVHRNSTMGPGHTMFIPPANVQIPDSVDWRQKRAVTEVKDQGRCGSCWSFAATGAIEGQHFLKQKQLVSLSEQNLMDCSRGYENYACEGGAAERAFQYVIDNNGIDTEESYPYEGEAGKYASCRYTINGRGAVVTGIKHIADGDVEGLKVAIATVGPIAIAIDAERSFQHYRRGIYYASDCVTDHPNHAVLAVGYGPDYILVKNSWGTSWGDEGYIKMASQNNQCGIASYAFYPIVD